MYRTVRRNPTGWARPGPGRRAGWRLLLRSRLDYTVLAQSHHTAIDPVGTEGVLDSGTTAELKMAGWAGQRWVVGAT